MTARRKHEDPLCTVRDAEAAKYGMGKWIVSIIVYKI
jgi:hypothetical protein